MNRKIYWRVYQFDGNGESVTFTSYGKKGSKENYEDLKTALNKRYGRYACIKTYEDYKREIKRFGVHLYICE